MKKIVYNKNNPEGKNILNLLYLSSFCTDYNLKFRSKVTLQFALAVFLSNLLLMIAKLSLLIVKCHS